MGVWGYFQKKTPEVLYVELKERAEAATSNHSAAVDFLQDIYSVIMAKNHQKLDQGVNSLIFIQRYSFNDTYHGYRAAVLKKSSLWLLPFYMAVATYCYYEKMRRTMRGAILTYLLK